MARRLTSFIVIGLVCAAAVPAVVGGDWRWQHAAAMCALSMAFCIAVVSRRIAKVRQEQVPDFLTVLLLFQIANKLMTIIALAFGQAYMNQYELQDLVELVYAFQGEAVFFAANVLFTAGWILVERRRTRAFGSAPIYSVKSLLSFYIIALFFSLMLRFGGIGGASGLMSSFALFSAIGAVGLLLSSKSRWGISGSYRFFTLLMMIPLIYLALISGTKGQLVVVALPFMVAGLNKGTTRLFGVLLPFVIFMLMIGIPLSQEMRAANWASTGRQENIGLTEGLSRVAERYADGNVIEVTTSTLVGFCNRANSAEIGGLVMRYAEQDGLLGMELVRLLPAIFIPRVLWPEKPVFRPGAWFTWYRGRSDSPETATTSTAMGLGTEFYWSFGAMGVLLISILGALYSVVWQALRRVSTLGISGFAGMYALLASAVRFEEMHMVYAIAGPVAFLAYSYVLVGFERALLPVFAGSAGRR